MRLPVPDWSELTIVPDGVAAGRRPIPSDFVVPSDVTHVFGGYWDVYKWPSFRAGGWLASRFPSYPNRFRGWSRGLGPGRGKLLILHPEVLRGSWERRPRARSRGGDRSIGEEEQLAVRARDVLGNRTGAIPPS